jgi:hypothetical protein
MTEQPGNPTDPNQPDSPDLAASSDAGAASTPPPAAPVPPAAQSPAAPAAPPSAQPPAQSPAQSSAPAGGRSQYDFNQARTTVQGAHKFDLGIIAAGVIAWLAAFMPFYTASASFAGHSASAHASAYHGFFGWFAVWVALAGAVLVALSLFNVVRDLPLPLHQIAAGAFGLALLCLILALFITPGGDSCNGASGFGVSCSTGHGFGYWLALLAVLAGLALSVLRMRETTTSTNTTTA